MLSRLLIAALLSSSVRAVQPEQQKRQADGGAQFSAAASQLISQYIPSSVYSALVPSIQAAASSASVSHGDFQSLFYSALLATSVPGWFNSAIPSSYSQQFQSLEGDVSSLRALITSGQATVVVTIPAYVTVTTTDSAGRTITTGILTSQVVTGPITQTTVVGGLTTTTVPPPATTTFTNSAGSTITSVIGAGVTTTTFTNSAGSTITSVIGAGITTTFTDSAGSTITSVVGAGISGASSLATAIASGATSLGGVITGAGGSVIGGASSALAPASTSKAGNAAARPTAALQGGAVAAAAGIAGLMIAL